MPHLKKFNANITIHTFTYILKHIHIAPSMTIPFNHIENPSFEYTFSKPYKSIYVLNPYHSKTPMDNVMTFKLGI